MIKNILSVGIVDLKCNNLFSIHKSCTQAGYKTSIISTKQRKFNYDLVIVPGVGAYKTGMKILKDNNYDEKILDYSSKSNSFIYGICLGMQLLFDTSNEFGLTKGLGLMKGKIKKFSGKNKNLKTNTGWSRIKLSEQALNINLKKFHNKYFYFVHSYYAKTSTETEIISKSKHGHILFPSIVKKNNIFGTQFHPEKSGNVGINFLKHLKYFKG